MDPKSEKKRRARYRVEKGRVHLELKLNTLTQLFDSRDPAPFLERDLDDDAVRYILLSAQEQSHEAALSLIIHLKETGARDYSENEVEEAVRAFFAWEAEMSRRSLRKTLQTARRFFAIGFVTLAVCLMVAELVIPTDHTLWNIVREGFVISGWVAMWRPIELVLYDWWPLRDRIRTLDKLAKIPVHVRAPAANTPVKTESPKE